MPIKCYNKPNRSKPRTWTPADLARIFQLICDRDGPPVAQAAVLGTDCGISKSLLKEILQALNDLIDLIAAFDAVTKAYKAIFQTSFWRFVIRYLPSMQALEQDVASLETFLSETVDTASLSEAAETIAGILLLL